MQFTKSPSIHIYSFRPNEVGRYFKTHISCKIDMPVGRRLIASREPEADISMILLALGLHIYRKSGQ